MHCSSKHNLKIVGEKGKEIKQGTIIDEVAVAEGKFEFYLISQKCKDGIPIATKYNVFMMKPISKRLIFIALL